MKLDVRLRQRMDKWLACSLSDCTYDQLESWYESLLLFKTRGWLVGRLCDQLSRQLRLALIADLTANQLKGSYATNRSLRGN